jgi:hypothetical protein
LPHATGGIKAWPPATGSGSLSSALYGITRNTDDSWTAFALYINIAPTMLSGSSGFYGHTAITVGGFDSSLGTTLIYGAMASYPPSNQVLNAFVYWKAGTSQGILADIPLYFAPAGAIYSPVTKEIYLLGGVNATTTIPTSNALIINARSNDAAEWTWRSTRNCPNQRIFGSVAIAAVSGNVTAVACFGGQIAFNSTSSVYSYASFAYLYAQQQQ